MHCWLGRHEGLPFATSLITHSTWHQSLRHKSHKYFRSSTNPAQNSFVLSPEKHPQLLRPTGSRDRDQLAALFWTVHLVNCILPVPEILSRPVAVNGIPNLYDLIEFHNWTCQMLYWPIDCMPLGGDGLACTDCNLYTNTFNATCVAV